MDNEWLCIPGREMLNDLQEYREKLYNFYTTNHYLNCKLIDKAYMIYGNPTAEEVSTETWFISEGRKDLITLFDLQEKLE